MNLFLFGDSITYGGYDVAGGGWADRLKRDSFVHNLACSVEDKMYIFNLGISGESTDTAVLRFRPETKARIAAMGGHSECAFVFGFGANDAAYQVGTGSLRVAPGDFKNNLASLIAQAREFEPTHIALFNITPVVESVTREPNFLNKIRLNKYVDTYNRILEEVCIDGRADCIDIHAAYLESDYSSLFTKDGVHPNDQGHSVIYQRARAYLNSKDILKEKQQ